jgi:hypothetical protein
MIKAITILILIHWVIQRVAANIMNKWLQTADKRWSSSLEVGQEANIPLPQKNNMLENRTLEPYYNAK